MGGLAQALGHNVARALQGLFHVLDLPFHEAAGIGLGILRLAAPQEVCQRFQPFGHRQGGTGFPLGPIRKIQIFQLAGTDAVFYLLFKFCGKFILLRDGFEDGGLALFHLFEDIGPMFDLCHFYVREAAGALFAVAADKGNGAAVPEQFHAVFHLPGLFTVVKENPITSIKNQYRSGTCWCFSALSFLESEVIKAKGIKDPALYPDFSEMFVVRKAYYDRARKFVRLRRQAQLCRRFGLRRCAGSGQDLRSH